MTCLIKNVTVVDPKNKIHGTMDVLVKDGKIADVKKGLQTDGDVVEGKGRVLVPGLVDMHVHLREPGCEGAETIDSGCRAAAKGGFTGVACMPNTTPPIDSAGTVRYILEKAKSSACRVFPVGTISKERAGKELAPFGELIENGVYGFTDDGSGVMDSGLMRRALEYSKMFNKALMPHEEDELLSAHGAMHEGGVSTRLGIPGIPRAAEECMMERDIRLVKCFGGRLHITHVSTKGGVEIIRQAKAEGLPVTGESAPHYWTLFDKDVNFNTNFKMYPPLRTPEDGEAIIEGLKDGTLDAIVTDHAPHAEANKDVEYNVAAFGIIGLETSLGLVLTTLYHKKILDLEAIIERMSYGPCRILGVENQGIAKGADAHLTLIDLEKEWIVKKEEIVSKSKNSPFIGWSLKGQVVGTMVNGIWTYQINDD
ncbi:dihydroorotase [PVC group bacterium]|nr:dihydroorotase [PVC group bacterium]